MTPSSPTNVWSEKQRFFFKIGHGYEVERRTGPDILRRFLGIIDEKTALAFVKKYGPVQPMHACGWDAKASVANHAINVVIRQAERIRQIRASPRDLSWKGHDYVGAVGFLQYLVSYCHLRPAIQFDQELGTYRTGLTDQPDAPAPEALALLTCGLSAVIWFLMDEFAHRQGAEIHKAKCAACLRDFPADRIPSRDRRSWCPSCRGTARQWSTIKRQQRARP